MVLVLQVRHTNGRVGDNGAPVVSLTVPTKVAAVCCAQSEDAASRSRGNTDSSTSHSVPNYMAVAMPKGRVSLQILRPLGATLARVPVCCRRDFPRHTDPIMDVLSASPLSDFWFGGGEMGDRIRSFDWASTPLGPFEDWPNSLKTAVRIMLHSRYPMFVWWGPQYINIYNDAYIPVLGARHPAALGGSAPEIWREIWDAAVGPQAQAVMNEGKGTWNNQALLLMERYGYPEETYFTFSYSPVPGDDGAIGGVFCACTEETERVLSERRLRVLRQLASATAGARTAEDACRIAATTLAEHPHDIAFALIYFWTARRPRQSSPVVAGISPDSPAVDADELPWPVAEAITGQTIILRDLDRHGLPGGPWPEPCDTAMLLPLVTGADGQPSGFLVAGASPRRVLDDDYQGFFDSGGSVANAIANARAYEETRRRAEALAEIDRAKTIFFSNVSHEFRTPLTLMIGPLEDALSQYRTRDGPDLELAHRNGLRLLRLVNTLLDFSRIEAGRMRALYQQVDLRNSPRTSPAFSGPRSRKRSGVYDRLSAAARADLCRSGHVGEDRTQSPVERVQIHSQRLHQTEPGCRWRTVVLKVADSGSGIAENRSRPGSSIASTAWKDALDAPTKARGSGYRWYRNSSSCTVASSVESRPGIGSTFTVEIPAGKATIASGASSEIVCRPESRQRRQPFLQEALEWLPPEQAIRSPPHWNV